MSDSPRVAYGVHWFLKYASKQVAALAQAGVPVTLVCRDITHEFGHSRLEWQQAVDFVSREPNGNVIVIAGEAKSVGVFRSARRARKLIAASAPDLVHVHPNHDPALLLALPRAKPLLLTVHDAVAHPGHPAQSASRTRIRRMWQSRADGFIVHGEAIAEQLRAQVSDRPIWVIPHGIDAAPSALSKPAHPMILFLGRLEPYKGLDVLAEAMPIVWATRPEVRFVIAGNGSLSDSLGAVFPTDIRLTLDLRYVPQVSVESYLAQATLLVAPYTEASQSGVVSWAVGRGVPAIVTEQGALPDLVAEPGLQVRSGDPQELALAILRYLDHDDELRYRTLGHAEKHGWRRVADATVDVYRSLVS